MQMRIIFLTFLILCSATTGTSDTFTISLFDSIEKNIPDYSPDGIIEGEEGEELKAVHRIPELNPGEIILRKKNSANSYTLYHGTFSSTAFKPSSGLFRFSFKNSTTLSHIIRQRIFAHDQMDMTLDITTVYFDNARVYVRERDSICYTSGGIWTCLGGRRGMPSGSIHLSSEPPHAEIYIDGRAANRTTPATIPGLFAGRHIIELNLPDYTFSRRHITVIPDTTIYASFELLSASDTVYIAGDSNQGILILPHMPVDTPYYCDGAAIAATPVRLQPGRRRLQWHGGTQYSSLDTTIDIKPGKVTYFNIRPRRLHGMLYITANHSDASIMVNDSIAATGTFGKKMPTNPYAVTVTRERCRTFSDRIVVHPDSTVRCTVLLESIPDADGDGYSDSVDRCPKRYGLYDGCRRPQKCVLLLKKLSEVIDTFKNDNLSFGFNAAGILHKKALRRSVRQLIVLYDDGSHFMDNYRGLTMGNSLFACYKGIYLACELGQWFSGLSFRRDDTTRISSDTNNYTICFDTLTNKYPELYITSTSLAAGVHFGIKKVNISYSFGYRWEDLIFSDVFDSKKNITLGFLSLDNDQWFHRIHLAIDFQVERYFIPGLFFIAEFPAGKSNVTLWNVMHTGIQFTFQRVSKKNTTSWSKGIQ
ncbi:MAG: PEGA domain-containing protein [Chitinivibrionales bacterium]|nr:PEGA domain-containing protein [Chitinivibrionales bacterium]